ncbi:hypothetical protein BLNAU_8328 [Blattamonas nauphoetae]|uniref:Polynucleotide adenylyltransferase n=1 Tax=Blattamonas nauphoetae TaxID=2049346 RepID=A0ABQ9XZ13_9EUKA|nr:hypothetical protein BLNAU_8328 [Blattamonas nauphoetae]
MTTPGSDLDFTILLNTEVENQADTLGIVKRAMRKKESPFKVKQFNPVGKMASMQCYTEMPIRDEDEGDDKKHHSLTEFDLILENRIGMTCCDMVRIYSTFDDRVRPFLLLVKKWAKARKLGEAAKMGLSSYAWHNACIAFLQMCHPPVLPNIQSEAYIAVSDPSLVENRHFSNGHAHYSTDIGPWKSQQPGLLPFQADPLQHQSPRPLNTQSLGSLFLGFIEFLSSYYNNTMTLSIQHGGMVTTESVKHLMKDYLKPPFFSILDAFQYGRNLGASAQKPGRLLEQFKETIHQIQHNVPIKEIIPQHTESSHDSVGELTPAQLVFVPPPSLKLVCPPKIEAEIENFMKLPEFQQSDTENAKIELIRSTLDGFVKPCLNIETRVSLFGAAKVGLMTSSSTIDFTITVDEEIDNPADRLGDVKRAMRDGDGVFKADKFVPGARFPVIECSTTIGGVDDPSKDGTGTKQTTKFNLVFNRPLGIAFSDLVMAYCDLDERVRPFLLFVKKWTQSEQIASIKSKFLGSYGWTLISLCYLQLVSPPVIPNLQSEEYIEASDQSLVVDQPLEEGRARFSTDCGPWKSGLSGLLPNRSDPLQSISPRPSNTQSLGSLFVGFLDFMSTFFSGDTTLSLRHGALLTTRNLVDTLSETQSQPPFVVLDPFEYGKNAAISVRKTGILQKRFTETIESVQGEIPMLKLTSPKL